MVTEQLIHCVLCNQGFDRHESFVRHQRDTHSSDATMSPAVHKEMGSVLMHQPQYARPGRGPNVLLAKLLL